MSTLYSVLKRIFGKKTPTSLLDKTLSVGSNFLCGCKIATILANCFCTKLLFTPKYKVYVCMYKYMYQ